MDHRIIAGLLVPVMLGCVGPGEVDPGADGPSGRVSLTVTRADGSPRTVQVITHGVDGAPRNVVTATGTVELDVVVGGAVTAVDSRDGFVVSWLDVQPGDQLRDGQEPPPPATLEGSAVGFSASVSHVAPEIRFLRAMIGVSDGQAKLRRGAEMSATPALGQATGSLSVPAAMSPVMAYRTLVVYSNIELPEVPSSWVYDVAPLPPPTDFDASRALPFIDHTAVRLDTRRFVVSWNSAAALSGVQVGKLLVTWHDGDQPWPAWEVRFAYRGTNAVNLPTLPSAIAATVLPAASPTLAMYAEVALLEFADASRAAGFRQDAGVFGSGPVGANRDLAHLAMAGVSRLSFDTPF